MSGLIVAVAILGTLLVATIVLGVIQLKMLDKNVATLAECLLVHMTNTEHLDVIADEHPGMSFKDVSFPNSEGF